MFSIPIIKQCPPELTGGKILFAGSDGKFYNQKGGEVQPSSVNLNFKPKPNVHSYYPNMSHYNNAMCHVLVCSTFHGPRPEGYQCDHINGNIFDWRADNLQWVTPYENRRRARYIRVIRACGFDPRIFSTNDLLYWFSMPFEEFKIFFNHYKND